MQGTVQNAAETNDIREKTNGHFWQYMVHGLKHRVLDELGCVQVHFAIYTSYNLGTKIAI